jgi:hypothetical protein
MNDPAVFDERVKEPLRLSVSEVESVLLRSKTMPGDVLLLVHERLVSEKRYR